MFHSTLEDMLDDMLAHPNELFVSSNSKQCALYSTADGEFLFLTGDFSGTPEECEAEVRRLMKEPSKNKVGILSEGHLRQV
jgi:beta-lactamase superfamily II metal-dependent hydrolase